MSISRWMDKKAVVHIHNGVLLSHEKEYISEPSVYFSFWKACFSCMSIYNVPGRRLRFPLRLLQTVRLPPPGLPLKCSGHDCHSLVLIFQHGDYSVLGYGRLNWISDLICTRKLLHGLLHQSLRLQFLPLRLRLRLQDLLLTLQLSLHAGLFSTSRFIWLWLSKLIALEIHLFYHKIQSNPEIIKKNL